MKLISGLIYIHTALRETTEDMANTRIYSGMKLHGAAMRGWIEEEFSWSFVLGILQPTATDNIVLILRLLRCNSLFIHFVRI